MAAGADLLVISQGGNMDGFPWMRAAKSLGYVYASIAEGVPNPGWPDDGAIAQFADAYEGGCANLWIVLRLNGFG
jgi:hypothetical protein